MSTKTLRKRIALVAVSAMGFGLLTSVAANAASETFDDWTGSSYCGVTDAAGAAETIDDGANVATLVVPVGAKLTPKLTGDEMIRVTSPLVITKAAGGAILAGGLSSTGAGAVATDMEISATAVGTATIKVYVDAADTTASDSVTVKIVATCSNGTISLADSLLENQASATNATAVNNVDDVASWSDTDTAKIALVANSSYGTAVPVGTWIVTATNGALVGIAAGNPTCGGLSSATVSAAGDDIRVAVCQPVDNAPLSTSVTLTYGTQTVYTRNVLIAGELSKIEVSSPKVIKNNGSAQFGAFKVRTFDAAGNQLATAATALSVSGFNQDITAGDVATDGTSTTTSATDWYSTGNSLTCSTGSKGSATLKVVGAATSGATIYSPEFTATCGGAVNTWKASLDKASYGPGDVAVLTIAAFDTNGKPVYDTTWNTGANALLAAAGGRTQNALGATTLHTIAGSNMTVVTAPAAADAFASGVKTYQFTVGSTEGSYQMAVNLPDFAGTQGAQTVSYTIKSSSSSVTNAEVLAAIVKLIASINKQIAALQKALKK